MSGFDPRYARVVGTKYCDDDHAAIELATNEPPREYPYWVQVERREGLWHEGSSGNGPMTRPGEGLRDPREDLSPSNDGMSVETVDWGAPRNCDGCGSSDLSHHHPGAWESAWIWFTRGRRPGDSWECANCGAGGSWKVVVHVVHHWSIAPRRVYSVLRMRRSAHPSPATYFFAGVAGAVVGVVMDLALGWPWWSFALGAVALAWLFFASSMFWGVHRTEPFSREIRQALTGKWIPPDSTSRDS